jgi:hypothetical protein
LLISELAEAAESFVGHIEALFEQKELRLRQRSYSDIALAAIFRRSAKTVQAIAHLAKAGFGSSALGMSRSITEEWIVVRWLTNVDYEQRADRFLHYGHKQGERILEILEKYEFEHDHGRFKGRFHKAAEYETWRQWGPAIRTMAAEEEVLDADPTYDPMWSYDGPFFVASYHLHRRSWALDIRRYGMEVFSVSKNMMTRPSSVNRHW